VLITHDQEEALEVANRVVIVIQGRIEHVGTPDEVFHQPASEFVLRFLANVIFSMEEPSFVRTNSISTAIASTPKLFRRAS
jgi:ABC-type sulfate/molybdate transport systems ATPase subunit